MSTNKMVSTSTSRRTKLLMIKIKLSLNFQNANYGFKKEKFIIYVILGIVPKVVLKQFHEGKILRKDSNALTALSVSF